MVYILPFDQLSYVHRAFAISRTFNLLLFIIQLRIFSLVSADVVSTDRSTPNVCVHKANLKITKTICK